MAQAAGFTTAIRQLMSRGRPPNAQLLCGDEFDGRADHLEKVFGALHAYLNILIGDTAQNIPGGALDRRYLEKLFQEVSADALTVIRGSAEEMRERQNWRAP